MTNRLISFSRTKLHLFSNRFKCLLIVTLVLLGSGVFYGLLPDGHVLARRSPGDVDVQSLETYPLQPMLDHALDLGSVSEFSAFAERGLEQKRASKIMGRTRERTSADQRAASDLARSIDSIRQLPCTRQEGGRLGASLIPGVYCLNAAEISGEIVLDGEGSTSSTFVVRVSGPLSFDSESTIKLANGAQAGNVFFAADEIRVGERTTVAANLLSAGDINIGSDASVSEKTLALGKIEIDNGTVLGGTTGSMRICKQQTTPVTPANDLSNRLFHFVVTGATDLGTAANPVKVAPGTCSPIFDVTAGPQTVTELNNGTLQSGGTFAGNFELVSVQNATPAAISTLGLVNLATRTASVNVVAGSDAEQITLNFTNRRAITGFIEICKRAATGPGTFNPAGGNPLAGGDPDVTGFFNFTISGVYSTNQQNPNIKTLQIFTIPVGQCTGPLAVTKGDPPPFGAGSNTTTAIVSELPRAGVFFEGTDVIPVDRRNQSDVRGSIVSVTPTGAEMVIPAAGGGYVEVILTESATIADETLIVFRNRSNPSRLKICKIAGPGIPVNTYFRFTVTGIGSLTAAHPQVSSFGTVTRTVDVRAGDPAQGGTCEFVPGVGANSPTYAQFQTFVNGTPVSIVENGISPINEVAQNTGQLRNSQIRQVGSVFTPAVTAGFSPNPDIVPTPDYTGRTSVIARSSIPEVGFTGFRFNPTVLKICNVANIPSQVGVERQFTITLVSPTYFDGTGPIPMFPNFSTTVTVAAGPVGSQEGNCLFANGSALIGGAFNQGSTITVTQTGTAALVSNIYCPSCAPGTFTADLLNRRGTISGNGGLSQIVNSVVFVTGTVIVCRPAGTTAETEPGLTSCPRPGQFDFDGDYKADPAIFSPSATRLSYWSSIEGGIIVSRTFGAAEDKLVPADYDGDERTDIAVWRPSQGRWYIQGSTGIFEYHNWGEAGDVPQPGDYDGDGSVDFALFRPSNSTWYIRSRNGQYFRTVTFGITGDRPVAADFDGDGRTDIAVFRYGTWYTLETTRGYRVVQFGQAGDISVANDYDGDGAVDYAVYRGGVWYQLSATAYTVRSYGSATDVPVPADYDGDGKADIAYYRPSEGKWYIRRSALSESIPPIELGAPDAIPLQAPRGYFGN